MSKTQKVKTAGKTGRVVWTAVVGLGFTIVVIVLLMALAGKFSRKIEAGGHGAGAAAVRPVGADVELVAARLWRTPQVESAVGTIRAVHETEVASKLLAKVVAVNVQAGQSVRAGDVLVQLDDQDLQAQLRQAEAGVTAADAARNQAQIEFDRVKSLYERQNASKTEFDQADTALKTAVAEAERARQAQAQMQATLEYATIRSPIDGKVIDKRVEVGDTAQPGQALVTLYDPTRMQLVASVRESLSQRLAVGQTIGVQVESLSKTCDGRISEIVPEAESASRTFQVKVTGPCPPGVYTGMFGRLLIPLDEQEVLVIPRAAVRRVGQLDLVEVAAEGEAGRFLERRVVQLGRDFGTDVEVLAGLRAGEEVAVPRTAARGHTTSNAG